MLKIMVYIIVLWFIFWNAFKIVDLIDEHKWISWKLWFTLKYLFSTLVILSVYLTIKYDTNFLLHFVSIFLFWIFKNKMEYPSHVFIMFACWVLFWSLLNFTFYNLGIIGVVLCLYFLLDFIAKQYKNNISLNYILYKRLWRFYLISFFLSAYLWDYYIFLHTIIWLASMEWVRFMIKKWVIQVENPNS